MADDPAVDPVEATAEHNAKRDAARNKIAFDRMVANSDAKAAELGRDRIALLGFGTSAYMLAQILSGKIEPKDAKQAAEIAKIALDMARTETGEGAQVNPRDLSGDERKRMIEEATDMVARLRDQAVRTKAGWDEPDGSGPARLEALPGGKHQE